MKNQIKLCVFAIFIASSLSASAATYDKPTKVACETAGGTWDKNECLANWKSAQKICKLPTIKQWEAIAKSCGSIDFKTNLKNETYQNCYKDKGYAPVRYWTERLTDGFSMVTFFWLQTGKWGPCYEDQTQYVRCVSGQ